VWDLRARSLVYDLSTGNNAVQSLAWDSDANSLYAATECPYVDRNGYHYDYRYAKIPRKNRSTDTDDVEMEDEEDEDFSDSEFESDDSDFEEEDECVGWPSNAYHDESYYGHIFDSGEHRLCKTLSGDTNSLLMILFQTSTRSRPIPTHRSCRSTETRLLGNQTTGE